jgi:para-aminobenzoate synthetase component 1
LQWLQSYNYFIFLDSCQTAIDRYGKFEWIAAFGTETVTDWPTLTRLQNHWIFGGISYELKNRLEPTLPSNAPKLWQWPETEVLFFKASVVITLAKNSQTLTIHAPDPETVLHTIESQSITGIAANSKLSTDQTKNQSLVFQSPVSKQNYIATVRTLQEYIRTGDIYEINYCLPFIANGTLSPLTTWLSLVAAAPCPFAALFRFDQVYTICSSPERFLQLYGNQLISQPIKGTARRDLTSETVDRALAAQLLASEKERAENVMIVDLVRNDLYRSAVVNGVAVPYLFEIQTFKHWHHLVSTITAIKREEIHPLSALAAAFPPGSMTGAPKIRAMTRIDSYECFARGLYSGAIGYITPENTFDFNVVIRSLFYHASKEQVLYYAGGAITYDADPEAEYEEVLLKCKSIRAALGFYFE